MATWDDVRRIALAPPAGAVLGARVESLLANDALIGDAPSVYFTTSHFDGAAAVLVLSDVE